VKLSVLLVFVCVMAAWARGQADPQSDAKSKIAALEQLWNQAYKAGDTIALGSILDDAIVLVNDDGSVQTKAEFLTSVKPLVSQPSAQQQQVAPESLNVRVFGNVAIASGILRVKGVERGKSYVRRERFVDTWLMKGANWVCVGTDATPILP
jgi:ketosteroid isomerase-like protein